MIRNNNNKNQNDGDGTVTGRKKPAVVIDLLLSSDDDEEDDAGAIPPLTSAAGYRVLDDGCLEILDDDDDVGEEGEQRGQGGHFVAAASAAAKKPRASAGTIAAAATGSGNGNGENLSNGSGVTNRRRGRSPAKEVGGGGSTAKKKKKAVVAPAVADNNIDNSRRKEHDDEIVAFEKNPPFAAAASAATSTTTAAAAARMPTADEAARFDDDELQLVGSTGDNALADFPHARENCVLFPFPAVGGGDGAAARGGGQRPFGTAEQVAAASKRCPNCYCFVCDVPASECRKWWTATSQRPPHCLATYQSKYWKDRRNRHKIEKKKEEQARKAKGPARGAAAAAAAAAAAIPSAAAVGSGSAAAALGGAVSSSYNSEWWRGRQYIRKNNTGPSVRQLLDACTRVYPSERSPPPPSGNGGSTQFRTPLFHYQKQSLAFMADVEESDDQLWIDRRGSSEEAPEIETRGGWICSDVGMGKTAVVIALVATKPFVGSNLPKILGIQRAKATVVMTVNTINSRDAVCARIAPVVVWFLTSCFLSLQSR